MQPGAAALQRTRDLRFYWRQVHKRPWLILTLLLVSLILGGLKVAKTRPVYQATTKLLIEHNKPRVNLFDDLVEPRQTQADAQTQYEILRSRVLARRIIANLSLRYHPEFAPQAPKQHRVITQSLMDWITPWLDAVTRPLSFAGDREDLKPGGSVATDSDTGLVNAFLSRLQVEPVANANLVNVKFRAYDPVLAAKVTNTLARLYIDFNIEMRFTALQDALDWLEKQVSGMRQQVETSEQALQQYKDEYDIYLIDDHLPGVMQEIASLNTSLIQLKTERIELETQYNELQKALKQGKNVEWMPEVVDNPLVQNLKARYIDIQRTFVHLGQKYGDDHPRTLQLHAQLEDLEAEIDQEVKRIVQAFNMKYQVIEAKENVLASYLDTLKRQMHELNKKSVKYQVLKREAESNRRLSHLLLDRLKETSVSADLTNGNNISVIDSAEVPTDPMNVHPTRTVGMAGILGLLAGIGFVGLLGYLDNTLKTPDEAEEFLGFPVIGVIERFRSQSDENPNQLIALESPYGKVSEAFKTLRANLLLSYAEQPRKVYLITSPHPNDGKTTIAANLAVALSQTERRVLLVDADLRHSMVHKLFNIDNQNGLRERLLTETYDPSIVVSGDYPGEGQLSVITAGGDLANPSELLESKRMERFLAYARAHYDVVIIDTPPILAVSDAIVLSPLVDGILIVLRAGVTPYDHARRAIASFLTWRSELSPQADEDVSQSHDTPALGLVMNFLDPRDGEAYGYHHYPTYYYHQES